MGRCAEVQEASEGKVRRPIMLVAGVLAAIVIVAAVAIIVSRVMLERRLDSEINDLLAGAAGGGRPAILTEADLAWLPEPVRRWLRYSQVVGRERPVTVRLTQVGQFRLGE